MDKEVCPKCKQLLNNVLTTPDGDCISFVCDNDKCDVYHQELYKCAGGILLTKKELAERKRAEGEV